MATSLERASVHVENEEWTRALDALIAAPAGERRRAAAAEVDAGGLRPLLQALDGMKLSDIASLLPVALE